MSQADRRRRARPRHGGQDLRCPALYAEELRRMAERRAAFNDWMRPYDALLTPTLASRRDPGRRGRRDLARHLADDAARQLSRPLRPRRCRAACRTACRSASRSSASPTPRATCSGSARPSRTRPTSTAAPDLSASGLAAFVSETDLEERPLARWRRDRSRSRFAQTTAAACPAARPSSRSRRRAPRSRDSRSCRRAPARVCIRSIMFCVPPSRLIAA